LAAVAAALALASTAGAQDRRAPAPEIAGPEWRDFTYLLDGADARPRAALGISTNATGTLRDTLGLLVERVVPGGPAEKAGVEEGNRIAAIGDVSLRAAAPDVDDYSAAGTMSRRLVRALEKVKPGDEVELRVYRDGRIQPLRVRTTSSDSLFRRAAFRRIDRSDLDDRPALGIGIGSAGSRRDSLDVLVISVQDSSPAASAGLEYGKRIAAIVVVYQRVAHADLDDDGAGRAKAQRLQREVARLTPGETVTLRVYANGRYRDIAMKVARAGDLPRRRDMTYFGTEPVLPMMPMMPMMPDRPMLPDRPSLPDRPMIPSTPATPRMPPLPPEGRALMRTRPQRFELVAPPRGRRMTVRMEGMTI
jgi:predicted metalloprotease with PDZ domain